MEIITIILLSVICVLGLANLIILVYLASFLVRLRGFVEDVIAVMTGMEDEDEGEDKDADAEVDDYVARRVPAELAKSPRSKTWDEKYEEELDLFQRKIREERGSSGLVDLE